MDVKMYAIKMAVVKGFILIIVSINRNNINIKIALVKQYIIVLL